MFTEAQNTLITRAGLDTVFFQEFDQNQPIPGQATADTGDLFKVVTTTHGAYIGQVNKTVGMFSLIGETQAVPAGTPQVTNTYTIVVGDYAQKIEISKDLFDDNMFNVWAEEVKEMARMARVTQSYTAFNIFRNAFTGDSSPVLTADGVSVVNASHTLISGGTVSNLITGALNSANLNTAIIALAEQKNQAGVIVGGTPSILLVPQALFKTACELTQSALIADTANNAINVYRSTYGFKVYTSPYIGATAGGTDTRWFLLSSNHSVSRLIRQGIQTALTSWEFSDNRSYKYQANYRESYFVPDYAGIVGSTG